MTLCSARLSGWLLSFSVLAIVSAAPAGPALAQDEAPRFQVEPMDGSFLRLDRATGKVEVCRDAEAEWTCRTVVEPVSEAADEPDPNLVAENARLVAEVAALRERLERISALAGGPQGEASAAPGQAVGEANAERSISSMARQEIDEALEITDYALRRFRDLYRSLSEDEQAN